MEDAVSDDGLAEWHNAHMARKKKVMDKKIVAARQYAGILLVICGNGKGKEFKHLQQGNTRTRPWH